MGKPRMEPGASGSRSHRVGQIFHIMMLKCLLTIDNHVYEGLLHSANLERNSKLIEWRVLRHTLKLSPC